MLDRFYEKHSNRIIQIIGCWIIFFGLVIFFEIHGYGLDFLIPYGFTEILDLFTFLMLVIFGYKLIAKKSMVSWVVINVIFILLIFEDISMISYCYGEINSEKIGGGLLDLISAYSPPLIPELEMKNALIRVGFMLPILIILSNRIFLEKFKINRKIIYLSMFLGVFLYFFKGSVLDILF